jgi:hypothetical protein
MDSGKVNIAPPLLKPKWFRLVGVPLGNASDLYLNGDVIQVVEPWAPPDTWEGLDSQLLNRILTAIDAGMPDGNRYTDATQATVRAAWKVVLKHAPSKSEAQARAIIKTWVKNDVLVQDDFENPTTRKTVKAFVWTTPRGHPDVEPFRQLQWRENGASRSVPFLPVP